MLTLDIASANRRIKAGFRYCMPVLPSINCGIDTSIAPCVHYTLYTEYTLCLAIVSSASETCQVPYVVLKFSQGDQGD